MGSSGVNGGRIYTRRGEADRARAEGEEGEEGEDGEEHEWAEVEAVNNGESRLGVEDKNTQRKAAMCLLFWKGEVEEEDAEDLIQGWFHQDALDWRAIYKKMTELQDTYRLGNAQSNKTAELLKASNYLWAMNPVRDLTQGSEPLRTPEIKTLLE